MATQLTLANGERVQVNDHVYVSSTWEARDGTPYSIARIMEFLSPESSTKPKKNKNQFTRVRIAWFYRPGDVSDRQVADSRLLLTAIFSEIVPLSYLRAKCYVRHKDKIADLAAWKKRPDRFYFHRLFDPFIKKEFEVILSSEIHNLPANIKDVLMSRYEFVVAEKEVVSDLTDSLRLCEACNEWCANPDTVRCDHCKRFFHMSCVQPPLFAKPSRGYGWTCASCSRRHEEEVDAHGDPRNGTPPIKARGFAKQKAKQKFDRLNGLRDDKESDDHYFKMWPFRYFGQYTVAEDTLDPDDLIFPRSATRVGPRFQTNVSLCPDTTRAFSRHPASPFRQHLVPDDISERGGDATIEILSSVCNMQEDDMEEVEQRKTALASRRDMLYSVDFLDEVMYRCSEAHLRKEGFTNVNMKGPMRMRKWKMAETRYADREWNDEEIRAFNAAVAEFGGELRAVRDEVQTRTMPEIVRYFGKWKNAQLRLKHRQAQLLQSSSKGSYSKRASTQTSSSSSDDEGSIMRFDEDNGPPSTVYCGSCRTRDSPSWWKAPKGMPSGVLCDVCGISWRKYGDHGYSRITRDDPIATKRIPMEKREGTPLLAPNVKRVKTTASGGTTPTPPPTKQSTCQCCKRPGPVGKVIKCKQCALTVHASSCGAKLDEDGATDAWLCDLCHNESTLEANLGFDCVLCPRIESDKKAAANTKKDTGYLRCAKPTEGQGWVHALCSVFTPEVAYADANAMKIVEGVSSVPSSRWSGVCTLCGIKGGAVIRCSECPTDFHISCAWRAGHKFGFELQSVKTTKRDVTTMVIFRGYNGLLVPYISCPTHGSDSRRIFTMCDIGHNGESALQAYCRTYKQVAGGHSYPLLRKARRLDALIVLPSPHDKASQSKLENGATAAPLDPRCCLCDTEFSPMFYPFESDAALYSCHKCHFEALSKAVGHPSPSPDDLALSEHPDNIAQDELEESEVQMEVDSVAIVTAVG